MAGTESRLSGSESFRTAILRVPIRIERAGAPPIPLPDMPKPTTVIARDNIAPGREDRRKHCRPANTRPGILLFEQSSQSCATPPCGCCGNNAMPCPKIAARFSVPLCTPCDVTSRRIETPERIRLLRASVRLAATLLATRLRYTCGHLTYTPGLADPRSGH